MVSWKLGCFEETAEPPNFLTGHCVGISTMNQNDALSPTASSQGVISATPGMQASTELCHEHTEVSCVLPCQPMLQTPSARTTEQQQLFTANNSPGDKDLSMCHMRAVSLNSGLNKHPCSSLVPLLHEVFLPSTAILLGEILQSNL